MLEHFGLNLSFYVFVNNPELFSIQTIFLVDDRLERMLLLRLRPVVWN